VNKKSGNTTIYDVAKAAKVSVSTVSKILNGSAYKFADNTRKQVLDIAKELGYKKRQYNESGERKAVYNKIAVIFPDIINPYYASLVTGLESSLRAGGMDMVFFNSHNNRFAEVKIADQLLESDCIGLIIVSICDSYDHIKRLIDHGIKVVAFEQHVDLDCSKVGFNYSKGGFMAAEYLLQKGYKKIGFISSPMTRPSRKQVFEGYKKALARYNAALNEKYIKIAENEIQSTVEMYDYQNGINLVQELISQGDLPDAIFCINDITAIGAIKKLKDSGYRVPEDIGVIGFDNICFSYMIAPALTTIEQSTYELGAMAAEILIGSINDQNRGNISVVLEPKLIIRDSV